MNELIEFLNKNKKYSIWEKANGIFRAFFIIHELSFSPDSSRECSANIHFLIPYYQIVLAINNQKRNLT